MEISKVQDSISILLTLQSAVDACLDITGKEGDDEKSNVRPLINGMLLIYAISFIEEWENLGKQCKDDNRVIKVRKIASPLIRRINQWTDLYTFRNTFLAHNYRDNKGNNVFINQNRKELNIPNGFGDFFLLRGCIFCAKDILIREFAAEYNVLLPHLKTIQPPIAKKSMTNELQAINELNQLIAQSKSIWSELSGESSTDKDK